MAGTIRGRLLCHLSGSTTEARTNTAYVTTYQFLSGQLAPAGIVTEIARLGGQNFFFETGSGTDPVQQGDFSVWRWNSNSNRSWEWYMLVQDFEAGTGGRGNPAELEDNTLQTGLGFAAGIALSGTFDDNPTTVSPWAGSGILGSGSKGDPVWTTGSGDSVHVFPRRNSPFKTYLDAGPGSAAVTSSKSDLSEHNNFTVADPVLNIWADDDSFLVASKNGSTNQHDFFYMGPYTQMPDLSSSIPCPFVMYRLNLANTDIFDKNDSFAENESLANGLLSIVSMSITLSSSELFSASTTAYWFPQIEYFDSVQPNMQLSWSTGTASYDEPPVFLARAERPFGIVGYFDSQLLRHVPGVGFNVARYAMTNSGSTGPRRALLPRTTASDLYGSLSVYWTGSFLPGTGSGLFHPTGAIQFP